MCIMHCWEGSVGINERCVWDWRVLVDLWLHSLLAYILVGKSNIRKPCSFYIAHHGSENFKETN